MRRRTMSEVLLSNRMNACHDVNGNVNCDKPKTRLHRLKRYIHECIRSFTRLNTKSLYVSDVGLKILIIRGGGLWDKRK